MNIKWIIIYALFFITTILSLTLIIVSCQMNRDKTPEETIVITEEDIGETITSTPIISTPTSSDSTKTPTSNEEEATRELIEVDSILYSIENNGVTEEFNITYETDFYDALAIANAYQDSLKVKPNSLNVLPNSEVTFDFNCKIGDKDYIVSGKLYYINEYEYFWDLISYDSENNPAYVKQYISIENDGYYSKVNYSVYSYKDEVVLWGEDYMDNPNSELDLTLKFIGKNQKELERGSDFYLVVSKASLLQQQCTSFKLLQSNIFKYNYTAPNKEVIELDFSVNFKQNFKLYQDYIIFEQSSPFTNKPDTLFSDEMYEYYIGCLEMGGNFTQTVVYDLKRNGIEEVIIKGHTLSSTIAPLANLDVDISVKIKELDNEKYNNEIVEFIKYAKENMVIKVS